MPLNNKKKALCVIRLHAIKNRAVLKRQKFLFLKLKRSNYIKITIILNLTQFSLNNQSFFSVAY